MTRLVSGVGFNDNKYPCWIERKRVREYRLWQDMLLRCTQKYWDKFPTYTGTSCSENFKSYAFFYEWCNRQTGLNAKDENGKSWQLDKDILIKGSKLYSEDTCVFVSQRVNYLLVKRDRFRGKHPIGVCWDKQRSKYLSRCCNGFGGSDHLGYFDTTKDAFQAYKNFKEQLIKQVANEYKEQIDPRVYNALMKYEVNIND